MNRANEALRQTPQFQKIVQKLAHQEAVYANGLWGTSYAFLTANLAQERPGHILLITATGDEANNAQLDLEFFLGHEYTIISFPAWEVFGDDSVPLHRDVLSKRLEVARSLHPSLASNWPKNPLIVAPIQALQQPLISPGLLQGCFLNLSVGEEMPMARAIEWLETREYERLPRVDGPGEYSVRGGILDIFPIGEELPIRVEYFGDTVDSLRRFDPVSQRSTDRVRHTTILGLADSVCRHLKSQGIGASFLDYVRPGSWIIVKEPAEVQRRAGFLPGDASMLKELYDYESINALLRRYARLYISELPGLESENHVSFNVRPTERFSGRLSSVPAELGALAFENDLVVVACQNTGERTRLMELLASSQELVDTKLVFRMGTLLSGFEMDDVRAAFVAHHELFHRGGAQLRPQRPRKSRSAPIEDWLDLVPGTYVVHLVHGVGRYLGMHKMERNGELAEFLAIEFAEGAKIHIPVTHIDLVQRYVGPTNRKPKLSKLGSTRWAKKKQEVKDAVADMAMELLRIQAAREALPGTAFPPDDDWQAEFEAEFPFIPTEDQLTAAQQIKEDMMRERPMDRLLCGDVGYGKTEVAMRAAFKAVLSGKQVAILCPTTVLAQQHYRTFSERMADYPVTIEVVSRFRSKKEQQEIIKRLRGGSIDILIGTHRLVQKDVDFRDLGLLIIDEEQRFGVAQKEFLKWLRQTVDVLTMTATPIPRTLHMALLGIRDICALTTPPPDRQSIRTMVTRYDPRLIREAILREMHRGGQVYFVHNRVYNIERIADKIRSIVPEAKVVVAHGQMPADEIDQRMTDFVMKKYDLLVCTTIIGSGVDIPNVNTIFVNDADRFGLAELHQLRGRVGRYKYRAYAYFLLPENRPITPKGIRRLKAIEEFSELGAGFKIAMRDLEIRGSGNILGPEQSGHIGAVGYELYCKLLDLTVKELKNKPLVVFNNVRIELGIPAYLPDEYIPDDRQKMEIYRRLAQAHRLDIVEEIRESMIDRFGPIPQPASNLLLRSVIRILAQPWEIEEIYRRADRFEFVTRKAKQVARELQLAKDLVRLIDHRTVHVLFPDEVSSIPDICEFLREMLFVKKADVPEDATVISPGLLAGLQPGARRAGSDPDRNVKKAPINVLESNAP